MPNTTKTPTTLGSTAIGSVEPAKRMQQNLITRVQVLEFSKELQDKHSTMYRPLDGPSFMPRFCIDGRHFADKQTYLAPNAAGGVFTLLVADMLTSQTFRNRTTTTADYAKNLFLYLNDAGYEGTYGDHDHDQPTPDGISGCGAIDYMATTVAFIARQGRELRQIAEQLNIPVDDNDHAEVIRRARELTEDKGLQFSTGAELRNALASTAGEESVTRLTGQHNEVTFVVNNQKGTSIDPSAYDDVMQAFNYDRWAMQKAVHVIGHNLTENEARRKLLAADYFNLATLCVLAGPSLYIVSRQK
jgi:hypothetical protein